MTNFHRIVNFFFTCLIVCGLWIPASLAQSLSVDDPIENDFSALRLSEMLAQKEFGLQNALLSHDTSTTQKLAIELAKAYARLGFRDNATQILTQYDAFFTDQSTDSISLVWLGLSSRFMPTVQRLESQKKYLLLAEKVSNTSSIIDAYQLIINTYLDQASIDKAELYLQSYYAWVSKAKPSIQLKYRMIPTELKYAVNVRHQEMIDSISMVVRSIFLDPIKTENKQILYAIYLLDSLPNSLVLDISQHLLQRENKALPIDVKTRLIKSIASLHLPDHQSSLASQLDSWNSSMKNKRSTLDSIQSTLQNPVFLKEQHASASASMPGQSFPIFIWIFSLLALAAAGYLILKWIKHKKNALQSSQLIDAQIVETTKQIDRLGSDIDKRVEDKTKLLEQELIEQKKLDNELRSAIKKAEEANYLKNSFMANMSHEIRTPLNGILGFASLLETELALIENKELFDYANSIQQSGEKLLRLLNNIIDISRLQANDVVLKKEIIDVNRLVTEVIKPLQFRASDKGIKIVKQLCEANKLEADYEMVTRILHELLDNSLMFTEKGYIKVSCQPLPEENCVEILISDTGIGIDTTYLSTIFEPFRQESSGYSKQYQGAGLGLPLVKQMTQLMGGSFSIQSEKSIGTTVAITFPMASTQLEDQQIVISKESTDHVKFEDIKPDKNSRVLIVEDEKSNMIVISKYLEPYFSIEKAFDGAEAVQTIKNAESKAVHFDLMLFDINLPAPWDGIKLMHWIKEQYPHYQSIPFVAQTAYSMVGDRERFIDAGFNGYIAKPITKDKLMNTIAQVMIFNKKTKKN